MKHPLFNGETIGRVQQALNYWQEREYQFVNLPWLASRPVLEYTRPPQAQGEDIHTPHGGLVASGEQSFIQLWLDGKLKPDTGYIGWTPCFRQEAVFDALHHFYFIKAELFVLCASLDADSIQRAMVREAKSYFVREAGTASVVSLEDSQIDIEVCGIEVGSYGQRKMPTGETYVYGTALAEPRLSQAILTKQLGRTANS